jgi:hypothetical protein
LQSNFFYYGDWVQAVLDIKEANLTAQDINSEKENFFLKSILKKIRKRVGSIDRYPHAVGHIVTARQHSH